MRISLIILLSLATNVVLALIWLRINQVEEAKLGDVIVQQVSITPVDEQSAASSDAATGLTSQGSWADLEADDLKEFVRRLRTVSCPEETIKDLVLAELNRRYSLKQKAIWNKGYNPNDYWKSYKPHFDPAEAKMDRERFHQSNAGQKEKTGLIVELFGVDVEKQRREEEGLGKENGWGMIENLTYLPETKRDAVQKYLDGFQDKQQEFYASVQGGWDADAHARQKQLEQEKMDGLAQILTPQELREYALRNSQMALQIQSELHGVDLTRDQYEALFDVRSKYGDSIFNWSDQDDLQPSAAQKMIADAANKQIEQNKKDLKADIASALGPDKAQQLERAQDYSYQQLNSLARHNDLPADTAGKIYDFKGAAEKAVQDLQANTDLTEEQRQTALAQIKTETEQAVKTALGGDKTYKRYMNNGGWWLNNLASPPPRHN